MPSYLKIALIAVAAVLVARQLPYIGPMLRA